MKIILKNKIILIIAAVILFFCTVFSAFPFFSQSIKTYAANNEIKFDETNVLDDLKSSTVNGKPFNIYNYPFDSTGKAKHPEIINFVEYCYSFKVNMQGNYGLYLYFYNPQALNIDVNSLSNKVQLAVSYNADETPKDYDKFSLKFISKSEESSYKNLFYKFKIIDRKGADGKTILQRVNSNERRYDISGIELATVGAINATDYTVGGTYNFTGYVKGYGADDKAESNLTVAVNELETVRLEVKNTVYRTNSSSLGEDHQTDLNSVYFSVDNDVLKKYGRLQKIKAEWYEYKTNLSVISKDINLINALLSFMGVDIGEHTDMLAYKLYYDLFIGGSDLGGRWLNYGWSYNIQSQKGSITQNAITLDNPCYKLYMALLSKADDFTVFGKDFAQYINDYNASYDTGTLPIKNGMISADLFLNGGKTVDTGRTAGFNPNKELDNDNEFDWFNMPSYDSNHNSWEKFWDFGFFPPDTGGEFKDIKPIREINDKDLLGSNEDISKALLINSMDIPESGIKGTSDYVQGFKTFYEEEKAKDKTTFLFRFATTDYYSQALIYAGADNKSITKNAYLGQQTIFLDFDILQLTFNRDGNHIVIPVVSNPIDIINGFTPPPSMGDNGCNDIVKIIVMVIALLILFIIISPLLPLIIRFVVWVISLPFKLVGGVINLFKKKDKKGSDKK